MDLSTIFSVADFKSYTRNSDRQMESIHAVETLIQFRRYPYFPKDIFHQRLLLDNSRFKARLKQFLTRATYCQRLRVSFMGCKLCPTIITFLRLTFYVLRYTYEISSVWQRWVVLRLVLYVLRQLGVKSVNLKLATLTVPLLNPTPYEQHKTNSTSTDIHRYLTRNKIDAEEYRISRV